MKITSEMVERAVRALAALHRHRDETDGQHEDFIRHMRSHFEMEARAVLGTLEGLDP